MYCTIIFSLFYKHNDFIEGNENFKMGGEDLEKLKNFKLLTSKKLLFFQIFTTLNILEVLSI